LSVQKALEIWVNVMDHSALSLAMDNKLSLFVCKIDEIDLLGTEKERGTSVTI
jgi:uridylate kinase